jgi:SAM-dependent methyltransferase
VNSDQSTADAFATSWNNLPSGSVYSTSQAEDWFAPLTRADVEGRRVLELGCGNASLMVHMIGWRPARLEGVDLGDSVRSATENMTRTASDGWAIRQADLTTYTADVPFDVVYSIGVIHHLKEPVLGFRSLLRNVRPGGRFHGWVYAREGNAIVRAFVDPIRKVACKLPWWFTKYLVATPLVTPYYLYAKVVRHSFLARDAFSFLPLHAYSLWIAQRDFAFFRHVAFDQLVTPQTAYIPRATIEEWLRDPDVEPGSTYVIFRNGNSWKFGGRRRA